MTIGLISAVSCSGHDRAQIASTPPSRRRSPAGGRLAGAPSSGLYACMYFAALRPAEVVELRRQDCHLPATGWGRLTLEKSRPEVNRRWTDNDSPHDERGPGSNTGQRGPILPGAPSRPSWWYSRTWVSCSV